MRHCYTIEFQQQGGRENVSPTRGIIDESRGCQFSEVNHHTDSNKHTKEIKKSSLRTIDLSIHFPD